MGRRRLVGRRARGSSTPARRGRCGRTRSGATGSARRVADDELVTEEPDERFFLGVSPTPQRAWIVIDAGAATTTSEVWLRAGRRPDGDAARSCGPGSSDVEYAVDHWGDRFVVLTNLDAAGLPRDDGAARRARRVDRAAPPRARPAVHGGRAVRRPPRAARVERRPAEGAGAVRRDGRQQALDFGDEPHDLELGANPEWDTTSLRVSYQSLTTPRVGVRRRRRHRRADAAQADADAGRRPRPLRRRRATWATAPDGTRGAGRRRPPRRHAARRHRAVRRLRLRRPTRSRCRRGSRSRACRCSTVASCGRSSTRAAAASSGGGGTSTASCSTSATRSPTRSPATEHVVAERLRRPRRASPSAAAAPAGCSSARASRCAPSCSAPPSPRCRSSTS